MISRLLPIVLIFIAGGLFFGYINPTYTGHVTELKAEIARSDAALAAAKRFAEKENELLSQRSRIPEEGLKRVEAFLPDGVDNVQLILDLNALASRSGLTLADFDIQASAAGESTNRGDQLPLSSESPIESLDLSLSATGSYKAFKTFLAATEWSLRPMDLVSLSVDDSATGIYTYDMVFRIYWLR